MQRVVFIFLFLGSLYADSIRFVEHKYIGSLHTTISRKGVIDFNKDSIAVSYKQQKQSYVFFDEYLLVKDGDKEDSFSYEDKIELSLFYKLIKLVYKDEDDGISDYFRVEKTKKQVVELIPKEYISNAIDTIEYKKDGNNLEFLNIYFTNEDRIKIVQD